MKHLPNIETQLENIIDTGYSILNTLQKGEPELDEVKKLFAKRRQQLDKLNAIEIKKKDFSKERHNQLRNLFTRLSLLEKSINNVFAKLSLQCRESIKEIGVQKKAEESYTKPAAKTSKFLDTKVNG